MPDIKILIIIVLFNPIMIFLYSAMLALKVGDWSEQYKKRKRDNSWKNI